jgi:hypothetical protein
MAFIIRHISTDRFWVSGADQKIRLGSGATKYTVIDGVLKNAESGMNVMHAAGVVHESSAHPTNWLMSDGFISTDGIHAFWDSGREMIMAGASPEKWMVIYDDTPAEPVAAVEEPVAAVEEPVAAVEESDGESVPDLVSDEDVPVARSAALIEEALNASLVVEDEVEDEVEDAE